MEHAPELVIVISIVMLILFIGMANNISKIKQKIVQIDSKFKKGFVDAFQLGEIREMQGKKQEALDCFYESLYWINKEPVNKNNSGIIEKNKKKIQGKITLLGGKYN